MSHNNIILEKRLESKGMNVTNGQAGCSRFAFSQSTLGSVDACPMAQLHLGSGTASKAVPAPVTLEARPEPLFTARLGACALQGVHDLQAKRADLAPSPPQEVEAAQLHVGPTPVDGWTRLCSRNGAVI